MERVKMPQLGESVVEGTLTRWLVKPGDRVARDQPLAEIETDKANAELPSPVGGVVRELLVAEGTRISVGMDLAVLDGAEAASRSEPPPPSPRPLAEPSMTAAPGGGTQPATVVGAPRGGTQPPLSTASPTVRRLAREQGVDLNRVVGTGEHGRITRDDINRSLAGTQEPAATAASLRAGNGPPPVAEPSAPPASRRSSVPRTTPPAAATGTTGVPTTTPISPSPTGFRPVAYRIPEVRPEPEDEVIPFDRRRRIIAEHMVYSKQTAPQVVCVAEVDLHRVTRARQALAEKERPSFTAFVTAATVHALRAVPRMNAHVPPGGDSLVVRKAIHLGIAVDVEEGLVVPVIRNADRLSLHGISEAIRELASKARRKALRPDDLAGATFTLSNPGPRGNLYGGAIINQPQVGILRMGEIIKRPVVVTTPDGDDTIVVHPLMYLALSYDHRVVDGVMANDFLRRIHDLLGQGQLA
jgi:2-oxoglutarate dehydrogenase E2 component (dihydrolipoamide succinyltransferase)